MHKILLLNNFILIVKDLSVSNLTSSSITVHWSGTTNNYTVWLNSIALDDYDYGNKGGLINVTAGVTNHTLTNLDAFRLYEIQAYYGNTFGNGSISNITTQIQSASKLSDIHLNEILRQHISTCISHQFVSTH